MATSRRTEIIDFFSDSVKEIDKAASGFDSSYTYNITFLIMCLERLSFIDEVNDFPALYLSAGTENRDFNTKSLTVATLDYYKSIRIRKMMLKLKLTIWFRTLNT